MIAYQKSVFQQDNSKSIIPFEHIIQWTTKHSRAAGAADVVSLTSTKRLSAHFLTRKESTGRGLRVDSAAQESADKGPSSA